jgi:hypothetical protein
LRLGRTFGFARWIISAWTFCGKRPFSAARQQQAPIVLLSNARGFSESSDPLHFVVGKSVLRILFAFRFQCRRLRLFHRGLIGIQDLKN